MNRKIKFILLSCLLLATLLLASACSGDLSPYGGHDRNGHTVSVKFDANGGFFATNTEIIVDSYDLSKYETNSDGKKEIKLFSPDDAIRGGQAYTAEKVDFYLAGWYTDREETTDAEGNVTYSYSGRWDFATDKLPLDPDADHTSSEPVLTLYAAWVPAFKYEFYTVDENGTPTLISTAIKDPTKDTSLRLPALNEETGEIGARNDFPALTDKTYDKIYSDPTLTTEIEGELLLHSGHFDQETATLTDPVMQVYCTTLDGLWFEVDSADQLRQNSFLNAHYVLKNDIDFEGKAWPTTFTTRNFTGAIIGNGYSIKNITLSQDDNSCVNFGLFGQLSSSAALTDVTFDGITVKINAGSRMTNPYFGILSGTIADGAEIEGVTLKNSKLIISNKSKLNITTNPTFGLVSGFGPLTGITFSENNTVAFADDEANPNFKVEYEYTLDADSRFTLTKK